MCRMPEYIDDPDTFNPSRFDPENKRYVLSLYLYIYTAAMIIAVL